MRILYNAFNSKNLYQHIIGNIEVTMEKIKTFDEIKFSYNLKNGYVFIDHFIEDGVHKSYLYKYCYFDQNSVYGEDIREKPIMIPDYIYNDKGSRVKELKNKEEIIYLQCDDVLYITFICPFGEANVIEDLVKQTYEKALDKLINYVKENEFVKQKITDIYMNENKVYFIYEKNYEYEDNDEEMNYQVELMGYTTNKDLADEICFNGYIQGKDIIVTDEMPKIQGLLIDKPKYVYVEVFYENEDEEKIKEIIGLKKSAYFSFRFINPTKKYRDLKIIPKNSMFNLPTPSVQYEKDEGHFYFRCETNNYMNKKEFSQYVQELAINYIVFRNQYEK